MFKIFEEQRQAKKTPTYLVLTTKLVRDPENEVAVAAVDEDGDIISVICVFEADGRLCLCDEVEHDIGFKLSESGSIVTY